MIAAVAIQGACAAFFVVQFVLSVSGIGGGSISWRLMEALEIAATLGLILGLVMGVIVLRSARAQEKRAEVALKAATEAFSEVVDTKFEGWSLTSAERDVGWFLLKGFSTKEIAGLRGSSEGTVKAQLAAIYRKAGVASRGQLIASLVEELLGDG